LYNLQNQSYALKDLGKYLKYPLKHRELDGLYVVLEYQRHLEERKPLDPEVSEYNEDDVKALLFMIKRTTKGGIRIKRLK
jgi:hypothetical protein